MGIDVRIPDPDHPLNVKDFKPVLDYIPRESTLLDVGCGRCTWLLFLRKHRPDVNAIGCDANPAYVQICRSRGVNARICDIMYLEFNDKEFDVVTAFHVLEHVEDDVKALSELVRVARKRVILILPARIVRLEQLQQIERDHYIPFYTPLTLSRLLKPFKQKHKVDVKPHYNPTGVYESWLVIIDI